MDAEWTKEPPKAGARVDVVANGKAIMSGVLISLDDDSDEYIGNVEEWARVRVGEVEYVFRRHISHSKTTGGWSPQGKSLRRDYGTVRIAIAIPPPPEVKRG